MKFILQLFMLKWNSVDELFMYYGYLQTAFMYCLSTQKLYLYTVVKVGDVMGQGPATEVFQ